MLYLILLLILIVFGRFAFPIFAFQLTEGYTHTKDLKKYFFRLLIFAIISQIPFTLFLLKFTDTFALNIFFQLLFGLLFMAIYDKVNKPLGIFSGIVFAVLAQLLHFDYGWYGIAIIMIFYLFKNHKALMVSFFIITSIIKYVVPLISFSLLNIINILFTMNMYSLLCVFTCLSIIFILFYNGKKGKDLKYFLYVFYPAHLLILYLLDLVI